MADKVKVFTDQLRAAASYSDSIRDQVDAIVKGVTSATDARGTPWGKDGFGKEFAEGDAGYLASRRSLLAGTTDLVATADGFAKNQRSAADTLDKTDAQSSSKFRHPVDRPTVSE